MPQVFTAGLQVRQRRTQAEIELVLRHDFNVLRFVGDAVAVAIRRHVAGFGIGGGEIDIVSVIFQTGSPRIGAIAARDDRIATAIVDLFCGTIGAGVSGGRAKAHAEIVSGGQTEAVAVLGLDTVTARGAFVAVAVVFIIALVLQREVKPFNHAEEIGVAIRRHTITTTHHVVVAVGIGVAAEHRQHIGPGFDVINHAIVTAVIERAVIAIFQACESEFVIGGVAVLRAVGHDFVVPHAIAGQVRADLGFAFKAKLHIGAIAVVARVIGKRMTRVNFTKQIEFIAVFIINLCRIGSACE